MYFAVNFIVGIHVYFVTVNALSKEKQDTETCDNKPRNLDLDEMCDPNDHKRFSFTLSSYSIHIQKRLYLSGGLSNDFFIDILNITFITLVSKLESLNSNVMVNPTYFCSSGIVNHKRPILVFYNLMIKDDSSTVVNCEFLVIGDGSIVTQVENLGILWTQLPLLTTENNSVKIIVNVNIRESDY